MKEANSSTLQVGWSPSLNLMKCIITYAVEREVELNVDNFNDAFKRADDGIKEGERIVSVRVKR